MAIRAECKRIIMKLNVKHGFLLMLFAIGCVQKDVKYYQKNYSIHRKNYLALGNSVDELVHKSDKTYKYVINFTGKRLEESSYISDSKQYYIDSIKLSENERHLFEEKMYDLDISYIIGYHDSIKFIFSGRHKDIIVRYKLDIKPNGGILIDTNTYLFFEGTR